MLGSTCLRLSTLLACLWLSACAGHRTAAPPPPPPPPKPAGDIRPIIATLRADRDRVCTGDPVRIAATAAPAIATYRWTINGQPVPAGDTLRFDTSGRPAATYTVTVTIAAPGYTDFNGAARVTVEPYVPPSATLAAEPSQISAGETTTLRLDASQGRCGGQIRNVRYTSSEGAVSATAFDSSGISFAPSQSDQRKTVTITAAIEDARGNLAHATTTIVILKRGSRDLQIDSNPPVRLPDLLFAQNNANITNCAKRVLIDELKPMFDRDPRGRVLVMAHMDPGESGHMDRSRMINAAAVLTCNVTGCTGLSPSQVLVDAAGTDQSLEPRPYFCGSSIRERAGQAVDPNDPRAMYRRVGVWFIPEGAKLPAFAIDAQEASTLPAPPPPTPRPPTAGETPPPEPAPPPPDTTTPPAPAGTPPAAGFSMPLYPGLILLLLLALLFMFYGIWTAAQRLRHSDWLARRSAAASAIPPPRAPGPPARAIVPVKDGWAFQVDVTVIHHYEDQERVQSYCAQLVRDACNFLFVPPGYPAGSPRWQQHFLDALARSDAAFIVMTAASMGHPWMNWQIEKAANEQRVRDIPLYALALDQKVLDIARTIALLEGVRWYQPSPESQTALASLLTNVEPAFTRDLRCFISYSHLHRDFASRLCAGLARARVYAWMDVEGIPGGAIWKQKIAEAIESSTHVLFLLTAESVKSEQVMAEIDWAQSKHKVVIPILEEKIELPFGFLGTQAIDFASDYDQGLKKLLEALAATPKPLQQKQAKASPQS